MGQWSPAPLPLQPDRAVSFPVLLCGGLKMLFKGSDTIRRYDFVGVGVFLLR